MYLEMITLQEKLTLNYLNNKIMHYILQKMF